jgi:hypothetical protein
MAAPMKTGIPPGLDLTDGYVIQFTALDPSTGAVDTGVKVSNASLLVDNLGGGDLTSGFADSEPLWVPLPNNLFDTSTGG